VSVQARDLALRPGLPVYFAADFGGMHPAVVYLTAVARALAGPHPLLIRYAVAAAGMVTIALTFFATQAIFGLDEVTAVWRRQAALLAAFILAITFPFLVFTRIGFESMLPAIPAALTFWALAGAIRSGQWSAYLLAGLALGLSLYTFDSARFLPAAVTAALLWQAAVTRQPRPYLMGLAVMAVAALIIFAPLGYYFATNWQQFIARAGVTSYNTLGPGASSVPLALLTNVGRTLAGFSLPGFGDVIARHNLPGRPIYDPFLSLLFWLGAFTLLRRPRRASSALLLSWGGVMLLPVILTDGAPTYTRILGALPALAGIAAAGGVALFRVIAARHRSLATATLALGLLFSLGATVTDYFGRWAADPALFDAFQVGEWQAATLARARLADGPVYLIPDLIHPGRPTFDLLLRDEGVKAVGAGCLAYFDGPDRPVTYVLDAGQAGHTLDRLAAAFPGIEPAETIIHPPSGAALFQVLTVPAGAAAVPPPQPVHAAFGPLALAGYDIQSAQPRPGEAVTARLYWQAQDRPTADHTVFLHLYAPGGEDRPPAAQSDQPPCGGGYPTSRWQAGEWVVDEHTLLLPPDFVGETAVLAVGVYTWPSLERLPLVGGMAVPGDRLWLAEVAVGHQ
jgi:4-amino-4-deoxy-L-arabinose transferase-like glycosyltransferase